MHTCARASVPTFSYLREGLTNCAEIWCVIKDPFVRRLTIVNGGVFPYIWHAWTHCAGIWYVVADPPPCILKVLRMRGRVHPFSMSVATGRSGLIFGVLLETH